VIRSASSLVSSFRLTARILQPYRHIQCDRVAAICQRGYWRGAAAPPIGLGARLDRLGYDLFPSRQVNSTGSQLIRALKEPSCLEFHRTERAIRIASVNQFRPSSLRRFDIVCGLSVSCLHT
jgi:hypothetical protein